MADADVLDAHGDFWLARNPDQRLAGVLTFTTGQGGQLRLDGAFGKPGTLVTDLRRERIHGMCRSVQVTLEDCREVGRRVTLVDGPSMSAFVSNEIYWNTHVQADEPAFRQMNFGVTDLTAWLGRTGIRTEGHRFTRIKIVAERLPSVDFKVHSKAFHIYHDIREVGTEFRDTAVAENHRVSITHKKPARVERLVASAKSLQKLVALGMDRYVALERMNFISDLDAGWHVNYHARWRDEIPSRGDKPPSQREMAFTFDQLGGEAAVARWLAMAPQNRNEINQLVWGRFAPTTPPHDRFLSYAIAAEGLHRRAYGGGNEITMKERLLQLLAQSERVGMVLVSSSRRSAWAERIVDERDNRAHNLDTRPLDASDDALFLAVSLHWVCLAFLLTSVQASPDALQSLVIHPDIEPARARLGAIL